MRILDITDCINEACPWSGNSLAISLRGGQKSSVPMVFGGGLEFRTAGGRGISLDYANRDLSRSMSDQRIHVFSVALNL